MEDCNGCACHSNPPCGHCVECGFECKHCGEIRFTCESNPCPDSSESCEEA